MGKPLHRCMMQNAGLKIIFLALLNGLFLPVYIFLRAPESPQTPDPASAYQESAATLSNISLGQANPLIIREPLGQEAGHASGLSGPATDNSAADPKALDSASSYAGIALRPTGFTMGVVAGGANPPYREHYRTRLCVSRTGFSGLSGGPVADTLATAPSKNPTEATKDLFFHTQKESRQRTATTSALITFRARETRRPQMPRVKVLPLSQATLTESRSSANMSRTMSGRQRATSNGRRSTALISSPMTGGGTAGSRILTRV